MPPFPGQPQPNDVQRMAWQMEHFEQVQAANQATATAIAIASANAQAQATSRAAVIAALNVHLAALAPAVATNADATVHLQAAQALVSQLS